MLTKPALGSHTNPIFAVLVLTELMSHCVVSSFTNTIKGAGQRTELSVVRVIGLSDVCNARSACSHRGVFEEGFQDSHNAGEHAVQTHSARTVWVREIVDIVLSASSAQPLQMSFANCDGTCPSPLIEIVEYGLHSPVSPSHENEVVGTCQHGKPRPCLGEPDAESSGASSY